LRDRAGGVRPRAADVRVRLAGVLAGRALRRRGGGGTEADPRPEPVRAGGHLRRHGPPRVPDRRRALARPRPRARTPAPRPPAPPAPRPARPHSPGRFLIMILVRDRRTTW